MKCFQCHKPAQPIDAVNGYELRECVDGHRTGILTVDQVKEIEETLDETKIQRKKVA